MVGLLTTGRGRGWGTVRIDRPAASSGFHEGRQRAAECHAAGDPLRSQLILSLDYSYVWSNLPARSHVSVAS